MKKSKCFWWAQMAVLSNENILPSDKLDILRVLMQEEYTQKLVEKGQEKKESEVDPY